MLKEQVIRFYSDLWNLKKLDEMPSILLPEFSFRGSLGDVKQGYSGFAEYVNKVHSALSDYHCDIEDLIEEDQKVFAKMKFTGTHCEELLGYPATFKEVNWDGCAIFTFIQRKISDVWVLGDLYSLEAQLKG